MLESIGLTKAMAWWIAIGSALMLFAAAFAVPWIVIRLPEDYFVERASRNKPQQRRYGGLRLLWLLVKNMIGIALLVLGGLMLVLPGQGLLTLLIAVTLLDFPGKYRMQRYIAMRPGVAGTLNWIRKKAGRPPLRFDRM